MNSQERNSTRTFMTWKLAWAARAVLDYQTLLNGANHNPWEFGWMFLESIYANKHWILKKHSVLNALPMLLSITHPKQFRNITVTSLKGFHFQLKPLLFFATMNIPKCLQFIGQHSNYIQ
jgi:hypothetical protein